MKRLLLVTFILILISSFAFTQEGKMTLGAGAELALPSGDFGDFAGTGFGGTANFLYHMNDQLAISGSVGYITWGGKSLDLGLLGKWEYSYSAIPILAGGRYYFSTGDSRLYGSAEIGLYMFSFTVTTPSYSLFGITVPGGETTESESEFAIAPGIGYEMKIGDNLYLDLTGKYILISDANNIAVRAGISFGL